MPRAVRSPADFWSGALFAGFGIAFAVAALAYEPGRATRMGPGFFPFALAVVLSLIGLATLVRSWLRAGPPPLGLTSRPMVLVLGAVVAFGAMLHALGLAAALCFVVLVSASASSRFRWPRALLLAGAVSGLSVLVFATALQLPIPVLGRWLGG